jgi:hypothetical protein
MVSSEFSKLIPFFGPKNKKRGFWAALHFLPSNSRVAGCEGNCATLWKFISGIESGA